MLYSPGKLPGSSRFHVSWRRFFTEWVKPLLMIAVFVAAVNLLFPRYAVQGHSMEPSLHESDRLFVTNMRLINRPLERGEVVVLISPHDGESVVKRVIGLPGEVVEVRGGHVYVNGAVLVESYINELPRYSGRWTVGADQIFVLGDNRNHSLDSADYGAVDLSQVTGLVNVRFYPLNDISLLNPPDYIR